jgi:hypothetical protein
MELWKIRLLVSHMFHIFYIKYGCLSYKIWLAELLELRKSFSNIANYVDSERSAHSAGPAK